MSQIESGTPEQRISIPGVGSSLPKPDADTVRNLREALSGIDLHNYVPEKANSELDPIRFLKHKEKEKERIVRIIYPGSEYPVIVKIPEDDSTPDDVRSKIETWKDIENRVMMDETTLWVIANLAARYNRKQPLILEGPPAVSKTFGVWVFSCIIERPFLRVPFAAGTRSETIWGEPTANIKKTVRRDIVRFLECGPTATMIQEYRDLLVSMEMEGKKSTREYVDIKITISLYDKLTVLLAKGDIDNADVLYYVEHLQPKLEGVKLLDESPFIWTDSELAIAVEKWGAIVLLDELNVAQSGVVDVFLPLLEVYNKKVAVPQRPNGIVEKHPLTGLVIAQNPPNVGGGREPLSRALMSRAELDALGDVQKSYIERVMTYFMTGNAEDFYVNGKRLKGAKDIPTLKRKFFKDMPKMEAVIKTFAHIHFMLTNLVATKDIGRTSNRDGGNITFDQRDISAIVDAMAATIEFSLVKDTKDGLEYTEIDWESVIRTTLDQVYLNGILDQQEDSDRKKVKKLIDELPLWAMLRAEKNKEQVDTKNGVVPW